jgi:hypothetical protein
MNIPHALYLLKILLSFSTFWNRLLLNGNELNLLRGIFFALTE